MAVNEMIEIGLPPVNIEPNELKIAQQSLPSVILYPKDTDSLENIKDGLLLYKLRRSTEIPKLKIYFRLEGPITESYSNSLTESFLASILRTSARLSQITQMTGDKDIAQLAAQALQSVPMLGPIAVNIGKSFTEMLPETVQEAIKSALRGDRFELPKLWDNSAMMYNIPLSFTLWCSNPNDDNEYNEKIVTPLKYLMKYVLPRARENGITYRWPYFVEADASPLFWVPEGMITELTIDKAPENGTLGFNQRPNMINIRMTISSIRNVMIQNYKQNVTVLEQNLDSYIYHLKQKRTSTKYSVSTVSATKVNVSKSRVPSKTVSETDKETYNLLKT